jgi:hypothetical protein
MIHQRSPFDISRSSLSVFPPEYIIGFMNQGWVQRDLGVPLNFSISSEPVSDTVSLLTGDPIRASIDMIDFVAQSGIKVALVFGDRDYQCNCKFCSTPLFPPTCSADSNSLI